MSGPGTTGRAAIWYARHLGWRLLPVWPPLPDGRCGCLRVDCQSPAKHPIARLVPRGALDAAGDEATLRRWWQECPTAGIGLATGEGSAVVVLDVDGETGWESLRDLEQRHGKLPSTTRSITGSGGQHIFFRHPGVRVPNRVALAPGLDVRGDGGYAILPPSGHVSGRRYEWEVTARPDEVALAPMPPWLLALLGGRRNGVARRGSRVSEALSSRPLPGERTAHFVVFMGYLRRRLPPDVGLAIARCWNECLPVPWDDRELERRVLSFYDYRTYPDAEQGDGPSLPEVLEL